MEVKQKRTLPDSFFPTNKGLHHVEAQGSALMDQINLWSSSRVAWEGENSCYNYAETCSDYLLCVSLALVQLAPRGVAVRHRVEPVS